MEILTIWLENSGPNPWNKLVCTFCFFWHPRRPQGCNDSGVKEILGRTPSVAKTRKWHFSPDWDVKSSWQVMVLVCMEKPAILSIVLFYGFFGASFFVKQSHQIQLKVNLLTELIWHENQRKLSFTLFVLLHVHMYIVHTKVK